MIKIHAKNAMNKAHKSMSERPLKVSITFVFSPPKSYTKKKLKAIEEGVMYYTKKPDLDNLAKTILDAYNNVVYKDDSQVVTLSLNKEYGHADHVKINIQEV